MAYVATVTRTRSRIVGRAVHTITIVETGITAGTNEVTIDNLPPRGKLVEHRCKVTPGDGDATTVDPELGTATTKKDIFENGTAAGTTTNTDLTKGYSGRTLYGRSQCNGATFTGTTGNVTTVIVIAEGAY